jgi:hypothetical protein
MDAEAPAGGGREHRGVRAGGDVVELEALATSHAEDSGAGPSRQSSESSPAERRAVAVLRITSGQPLEAGQEALGGRGRGGLREDVLQAALGVRLRLALRAGGEMRENALPRGMTELAVHQGGESVSQMLVREASLAGFGQ